jgi:hypothetical protein
VSAVPIQEATSTFDCKIPGCANEARHNRGAYAYLCDEHAEIKKRENARLISDGLARSNGSETPRPAVVRGEGDGSVPRPVVPPSFEGKAKVLVKLGRQVDRAYTRAEHEKAKCAPALQRARKAKEDADDLAAAFRAAVRDLLEAA